MSAQTGTSADFANRFTPKLVDLNAHGGSFSFTVLINGKYFTANNLRPDFNEPNSDAELALPDVNRDAMVTTLRERYRTVGMLIREDRCERWLIDQVLENNQMTFGSSWRSYLKYLGLADVEPSNRSYYESLQIFVTVWYRLSEMIAGA